MLEQYSSTSTATTDVRVLLECCWVLLLLLYNLAALFQYLGAIHHFSDVCMYLTLRVVADRVFIALCTSVL